MHLLAGPSSSNCALRARARPLGLRFSTPTRSCHGAVGTAQRLADLFASDAARVSGKGRGAATALRVLDVLRQRPLCTLRHLASSADITFPTASKAMGGLLELGITRELTGQRRNRVFVYDAYLNILNEGGEAL